MKDELKETIDKFVDGLTPEEIKMQLKLAYLQMERCKEVLNGADVEPVEMMDNGLSSDLELFYSCKKRAAECAHLNKIVKEANIE